MSDDERTVKRTAVVITTLICLVPVVFGLWFWKRLPAQVAVHFDLSGKANGYAPKWAAVFLLPVLLAAVNGMVGSAVRSRQNKKMVYLTLVIIPVVSLVANGGILAKALDVAVPLNTIIYAVVSVIFIAVGILLPGVKPNGQVGIRLPWIMHDDNIWKKTHRFAGPLWIVCGCAGLAGLFTAARNAVFSAALAAAVLVPVVYSAVVYFKYRK
jgi:uncharacterized membrane protein